MRTSLAIPALCVCVLVGGLVAYGWAQATTDAEAESQLVKSVIDQMIKAVNSGDLNLLLAQYADDAKIDSRAAGAKVSKPVYAQAMSRTFQQGSILSTSYSGSKSRLSIRRMQWPKVRSTSILRVAGVLHRGTSGSWRSETVAG